MQIPIHLSSQLDECLRELNDRRDMVLKEIQSYKFNIEQANEAVQKKAEAKSAASSATSLSHSNMFSDTNSDISSCRDSNYESDNNSVISFKFPFIFSKMLKANEPPVDLNCLVNNKTIELPPVDQLAAQTPTACLINSDDSDVTINESSLNEQELKLLSSQFLLKLSEEKQIDKKKNRVLLTRTKSTPSQQIFLHQDCSADESKPVNAFHRQISDGYSSSNTPLSASSISNEHPAVNQFFLMPPPSINSLFTAIKANPDDATLASHK